MDTAADRLLTAREVAQRLGVSVRTVHSWVAQGRLPAVRLSPRCTRVARATVDEFIARASDVAHPSEAAQASKVAQASNADGARPDLASVLWDVDPEGVDEKRHARFLIRRILEAGQPEQVVWLFRRYPRALIVDVIMTDRALSPRVAGAWRNILGADERPA